MPLSRAWSRAFLSLLAALLAGCSVRYVERIPGFQPGYTTTRLGETTYQVRIGEAWPKDWPDLEKFALYRAAEITEESGGRYFAILSASSQTSSYNVALPQTAQTTGSVTQVGNVAYLNATTRTTPGSAATISGGWYILDFKVLTDEDLAVYRSAADSQQIKKDLRYFIEARR